MSVAGRCRPEPARSAGGWPGAHPGPGAAGCIWSDEWSGHLYEISYVQSEYPMHAVSLCRSGTSTERSLRSLKLRDAVLQLSATSDKLSRDSLGSRRTSGVLCAKRPLQERSTSNLCVQDSAGASTSVFFIGPAPGGCSAHLTRGRSLRGRVFWKAALLRVGTRCSKLQRSLVLRRGLPRTHG